MNPFVSAPSHSRYPSVHNTTLIAVAGGVIARALQPKFPTDDEVLAKLKDPCCVVGAFDEVV